ncbi:FGGY family carbohydrate kinase [Marinobacterium arenosum]|uniref:FGGY family carbohydrate kinase n=1 Tax=Marinobacterium arenosum TaxID=2862496 RepID=UPI001C939EEE|nr:FGGY family carbohydrate kinase [Marinobacterium arenosum]MBY4677939.1 hypothetical protein [Marinobacterium arenosum]
MAQPLYLILDQGGQSSRALVYSASGQQLAAAQRPVPTDRHEGYICQPIEPLVASLQQAAVAACQAVNPDQRSQLQSAALVCQRSSCLIRERHSGRPLSPLVSWQDNGGQPVIDRLTGQADRIQALTGLHPNGHTPAAKWRRLLDSYPALQQADPESLALDTLSSYLCYRLCEESPWLIDPVNASRTLLYDIRRNDWSEPLLSLFGLRRDWLPALQANRSRFGTLRVAGLALPLQMVTGDQPAALFDNGWPAPDTLSVNLGTGGFLQLPLPGDWQSPSGLRLLLAPALVGDCSLRVLEGTVNGAGSALVAEAALHNEDLRQLDHWHQPSSLPLFLNGYGGLGSPDWQPLSSRYLLTDEVPSDAQARVLAVAESVLFLVQRNLDRMRALGLMPARIRLSGGLSRSRLLVQKLADLSQLPVCCDDDPEASARGAAWLLGQPDDWQRLEASCRQPRTDTGIRQRYRYWTQALEQSLSDGGVSAS